MFGTPVGAAYLVYWSSTDCGERPTPTEVAPAFAIQSDWEVYRAGLLTNVLNPRVALFFMAFLPQFVAPTTDARVLTFLFLGAVFIFNGTLWCLVLVWGASAVNQRLRGSASLGLSMRRAAGVLFVGLGVRLAVTK